MQGLWGDNQTIGVILSFLGVLFTVLGVLLFFDRPLLSIGNVLFLSGIALILGLARTVRFFFSVQKLRGTLLFLGGILLVFWGWTIVGIVLEGVGFFSIFGASNFMDRFGPLLIAGMANVPVLAWILALPGVSEWAEGYRSRLPV